MILCYCRQGFKRQNKFETKAFNKIEKKTGCKSFTRYHVMEDNKYVVMDHDMIPNHPMVPLGMRHLITPHRKVGAETIETMVTLVESSVGVAATFRLIAKEVGEEENMDYIRRDVYNELIKYKNYEFG